MLRGFCSWPPARVVETLAAAAVILWRAYLLPLDALWVDWAAVFAGFWFCSAILDRRPAVHVLATAGFAYLLAIYTWPQLRFLLGQVAS